MPEFDKKVARIQTAFAHEEPDAVPIISHVQTFALAYAGVTGQQAVDDIEVEREAYSKYLKDIYFDGTIAYGLARPLKALQMLGMDEYTFAGDGVTLQKRDTYCVPTEEIDEFIAGPHQYLRDKVLYRKCPALRREAPENFQALAASFQTFMAYMQKQADLSDYVRDHCDTPLMCSGPLGGCALDVYSFFRGFTNTLTDLRRRPEKTLEALEAVHKMLEPKPGTQFPAYPYVYWPSIVPAYINRKFFEKYFWPGFKRMVDIYHAAGAKIVFFLEGNWEPFYDMLQELPKGFAAASIEATDIAKAKREIGDNIAIIGGLPLELMKTGTKQECIDQAKRVIDECAPGGGFMLCTNKGILSPNDISVENLVAVNEFAREYGKY